MGKRKCCFKDTDNIPDSDEVFDLNVTGELTVSGDINAASDVSVAGQLIVKDGTFPSPSIRASDPNTGINLTSTDIDLVYNGVNLFSFTSALGLVAGRDISITRAAPDLNGAYLRLTTENASLGTIAAGSRITQLASRAGGCSIQYSNDANRGFYWGTRYNGGSSLTNWCVQGSTSSWNSVSSPGSNNIALDGLIVDFNNSQVRVLQGDIDLPGGSFINDTDTGFSGNENNLFSISSGGDSKIECAPNSVSIGDNISYLSPFMYLKFIYENDLAKDFSSNAFDGTITSTVSLFSTVQDTREYVLDLTNNPATSLAPTEYIDFSAYSANFVAESNLSFSMWIFVPSAADPNSAAIISFSDSGELSEEYRIYINNSDIRVGLRTTAGGTIYDIGTTGFDYTNSQWHHIAVLAGTPGAQLWVNGVLQASDIDFGGPSSVAIDSILVGGNRDSGGLQWAYPGYISNLAIFDFRLTEEQIDQIYGEYKLKVNQISQTVTSDGRSLSVIGDVVEGTAIGTLTDKIDVVRSSGAQSITLPLAADVPGKIYSIMNTAAHTTTILTSGSDIFDDSSSSISITIQYEHVTVRSVGSTVWIVI